MSEDENVGFHFYLLQPKVYGIHLLWERKKQLEMSFVNPDFQTENVLPFISRSFERNDRI